jgi:hypothetical protein
VVEENRRRWRNVECDKGVLKVMKQCTVEGDGGMWKVAGESGR